MIAEAPTRQPYRTALHDDHTTSWREIVGVDARLSAKGSGLVL